MISLDTETTGVDFHHGARPYFVTVCHEDGRQEYWEWDVDPMTREVEVPDGDLDDVEHLIGSDAGQEVHELVGQNIKFDFAALQSAWPHSEWEFGWDRVHDTLIAGHLLASNQPHDLTSMAVHYLGVDIQPYEDALEVAVKEARRYCRTHLPEWALAAHDRPDMPSCPKSAQNKAGRGEDKDSAWKYDAWLPRALARELGHPDDHPWWTVLSDYANTDSAVTLALWREMRRHLERRGLWGIYKETIKVLPVIYRMTRGGVTISKERLEKQISEYMVESYDAENVCLNIAKTFGYDLQLPKSGNNKSLIAFCFDVLKLVPAPDGYTDAGAPSLNKVALEYFANTLPTRSREATFIKSLLGKRQRDTAISYLSGYRRFWLPCGDHDDSDWYVLHPNLNPTGTDTLRCSSSNPNSQNISKKEGFNLRKPFGPMPGREWWAFDGENLELALPAYEAGEQGMIELFKHPGVPPYYGSNHLLIAHILHPKLFEECKDKTGKLDGRIFKERYKSSWYQWIKNGNFAIACGAIEQSGTADAAYHVKGAQARIKGRMTKLAALSERLQEFARKNGYVNTMPDQEVFPGRKYDLNYGYPLMCARTERGSILPTTPFSYHVQGTAMWWMRKAMVRCQALLDRWRREEGFDAYMVLQVHDELVFDMPASMEDNDNIDKAQAIRDEIKKGGEDVGVDTQVSIEFHPEDYSDGVRFRDPNTDRDNVYEAIRKLENHRPSKRGGKVIPKNNRRTSKEYRPKTAVTASRPK